MIIKKFISKMPKDSIGRIKLIITIILSLIFIFSWAKTFKVMQKRFWGGKKKEAIPNVQAPRQTSKIAKTLFKTIDENDDLEWIRCPFYGKRYIDGASGIVTLSGILWNDETPKAVINGEIVGLRDKVNKYTVINILKSSVILNDGTKNVEILLEE